MTNSTPPPPTDDHDPTRTLTVHALSALVAQATDDLRYTATLVEDLQTWTAGLPRTHVPHGNATFIRDFTPDNVDDPHALEDQLREVCAHLGTLADAGRQLRATAERQVVMFDFPKLVRA